MRRSLAAIITDPLARMDGARINELFAQHDGDTAPPLPADSDQLAILIDCLWVDARQVDAGRRRLSEILSEADGIITDLEEELRAEREREPVNRLVGWARLEGDLAALEALRAASLALRRRAHFEAEMELGSPQTRKGATWHKYAKTLAAFVVKALREANPQAEIGFGDDGPVAHFLAAVIPFITGEHPTHFTVARHLQRRTHKRKG